MKYFILAIIPPLLLSACKQPADPPQTMIQPATGSWRLVMQSPGGELPFRLDVGRDGDRWTAVALNGDERVDFDTVTWSPDGTFSFAIDHYESIFSAKLDKDGKRMEGEWTKVTGPGKSARLAFTAEHGRNERFISSAEEPADFGGRWAVIFDNNDKEPQPAVAEIKQEGKRLWGTFLTPVGDYRYLEGNVSGNTMYLSCFDGGHAFLFKASLDENGELKGDFWSRDSWHETWSGKRDENASLEDSFTLTSLREGIDRFRFQFPDLEGKQVSYDDPMLKGKVRLITIFGSWCPNCNDEAPFLQELYDRYRDRGLVVLGLAFEMTDDEARNRRVLKRFRKRHKLDYPILIAGSSTDKQKAGETLPDLNHVLAYPTTLLLDREGKVVRIHTGFAGPGTGDHYETLRQKYKEAVEALL
ncbi:MAG: TlpA disulfide reductase family protein [Acidobacteriota bacterium]|nr:TlpA disulfide reductase family protein [Acidobacteriota bacterium]